MQSPLWQFGLRNVKQIATHRHSVTPRLPKHTAHPFRGGEHTYTPFQGHCCPHHQSTGPAFQGLLRLLPSTDSSQRRRRQAPGRAAAARLWRRGERTLSLPVTPPSDPLCSLLRGRDRACSQPRLPLSRSPESIFRDELIKH